MNKKQKEIFSLVVNLLNLDECRVRLIFYEEGIESDSKAIKQITEDSYAEVTETCICPKEYTIIVYKYDDFVDTIIHELLHVLFYEYAEIAESLLSIIPIKKGMKYELNEEMNAKEHVIIDKLIPIIKGVINVTIGEKK